MSDNIMMNGKKDSDGMFYGYQDSPAWHGLGTVNKVEQSATVTVMDTFKGAFSVETRPVTVTLNGEPTETGDYAIVRSKLADPESKEVVFGYCTSRYNPLQPFEVAEIYDMNVQKPVETMAFLGNGNDMFISWRMPKFEVIKGDVVEMFGIVRTGFDTLKGCRLFTSIWRPVCYNTVTLAENWAKSNTNGNGRGQIWTGKHVNKNLGRDLGFWMKYVATRSEVEGSLVQQFFGKLAATPVVNDAQVQDLIYKAYPNPDSLGEYYAPELRPAKEKAISDEAVKQESIRNGIYRLFAGEGRGITPDLWGVMNATSEYFCNVMPSKKPIASSIMFGGRQAQIGQMVSVLKDTISK